jgi:hypothetical protein
LSGKFLQCGRDGRFAHEHRDTSPAVVYKPSGAIPQGAGTSARLTRNVQCVGLKIQLDEPCRPVNGDKTRCQGGAYDVLMTSGVRLVPTAAVGKRLCSNAITPAHSGLIARLSGRRWMVGRALGTACG